MKPLAMNYWKKPSAALRVSGRSAIGVMASILGAILGLAGFEHGLFEALHGNVALRPGTIDAIGAANRLWPQATEPAFTLIPNFLVTGIAAMTVSVLVGVWSIGFVRQHRQGGLVFLLLCILQYLVGGGLAPFGLALVTGLAALWIDRPLRWGWPLIPAGWRQVLAWPWLALVIALAAVFATTIGMAIFGVFPGITDPKGIAALLLGLLYLMEALLPLMVVAVFAHDSLRPAT